MDVVRNIRWHAQEDHKTAFRSIGWQFPIMAAGAAITCIAFPTETIQDTVKLSVASGLLTSCAYLTQTVAEIRDKLDYLKNNFTKAAQNFYEFEHKLTASLKDKLWEKRDDFMSIVNIKRRPFSTVLAGIFEGIAIAAPIDPLSKMAFGAMGMNIALNGIVLGEEEKTKELYDTVTRVKQYLLKVQEIRLKSPEMLDDLGVNLD